MAPALASYARSLLHSALRPRADTDPLSLGPRSIHTHLSARDDTSSTAPDPEAGIIHPGDINNKFIFVLFGLIGAAFVATGIWFFFWARNGGFYFKEDDWDDYKSTVLRRKGPNGTTLSGATTITDLGGGSVYKDIDDRTVTGYNGGRYTTMTGITGGVSDVAGREKRRQKRVQRDREKERRREEKRRERDEKKKDRSSHKKRTVGDDGAIVDEEAEAEAEEYLRNYRHEKPARVGGINRESDASTWDGSTNPTESSRGGYSESGVTEELIANQEPEPTYSPTKKTGGGIRKVYSTADKRDSRETERIRAEARRLQEKGRAATAASSAASSAAGGRRNFSWQRDNVVAEDTAMMAAPPSYSASEIESRVPGSWAESDVSSDVGTKVYSHHIPGLSSAAGSSAGGSDVRDYAEERRKNRRSGGGGYRRDR
ncbi:hypothetical protein BD289DRAFT_362859 [Coniella lustricola]|uniref:Endosomal spry domain-containing protein n=1 Tax=Coniella lustricola TaxID=2025994 RepID=A0A2T3AG14_9PEZI|nr:hypothetical protein BD289DRAFT_362859 [Coniella lustricola]